MTWGAFYCNGGGGDRADRVRLGLEGIPSYFIRAPGDRCRAPLADRWGWWWNPWAPLALRWYQVNLGIISPRTPKPGGVCNLLLSMISVTPRGSDGVY